MDPFCTVSGPWIIIHFAIYTWTCPTVTCHGRKKTKNYAEFWQWRLNKKQKYNYFGCANPFCTALCHRGHFDMFQSSIMVIISGTYVCMPCFPRKKNLSKGSPFYSMLVFKLQVRKFFTYFQLLPDLFIHTSIHCFAALYKSPTLYITNKDWRKKASQAILIFKKLFQFPFSPWCQQSQREWWVFPARAGWPHPVVLPPSLWLPHWWSPHRSFWIQKGKSAMLADYIRSPKTVHNTITVFPKSTPWGQICKLLAHTHTVHTKWNIILVNILYYVHISYMCAVAATSKLKAT